ncbi:MAG: Uma2 family endonuclease [Gammaproteobacteria bacterium]|nr:Uma2 family endonuclease [Gammaproteobacteria bacterium]
MMQRRPSPTDSPGDTATTVRGSLAAVYAPALYRPVPPVECDEDGYPFSDARPMAEGDFHGDVLGYARSTLQAWFADRNAYASTDKFLFLEEGNRRAAVVPDILVAFGPPGGPRQSYKHWEEGKAPDFILEVLSADNWRNDVIRKPALYADLGVREYWTFDPRGVRTDGGPPLEGWRFGAGGHRVAIPSTPDGGYLSQVLGLEICRDGRLLRFRDPESGEVLPDYLESEQMRRRAAAARQDAESRAASAEARAASAEARAASAEARLASEVAARRAVESRVAALERRARGQ